MRVAFVGFHYSRKPFVQRLVRRVATCDIHTPLLIVAVDDGHAGTWALEAANKLRVPTFTVPNSPAPGCFSRLLWGISGGRNGRLAGMTDLAFIFDDGDPQTVDAKHRLALAGRRVKVLHW